MSETLTFSQINDQQSSAYRKASGAKPTVLIGRTDGRITVGNLDMDTHDVLFYEDGVNKRKHVSLERLSDAHQEKLATELAGTALRGTEYPKTGEADVAVDKAQQEIQHVEAEIDALYSSLAPEDQVPVWQYLGALYDHEVGRARSQMSPDGFRIANRIRELQEQLKTLHEQAQ